VVIEDTIYIYTSPGLYMRDISEVKAGDKCHAFQKNKIRPENSEACFSLIGSERTICLELPGKVIFVLAFYDTLHI
jgi:hypothetical protein